MPFSKPIMPGDRFGRLIVLDQIDNRGHQLCRCDCGREKFFNKSNLKYGHSQSCGCLRKELVSKRRFSHGHTAGERKTKIYIVWRNMRSRCLYPDNDDYENYGGRGIKVCDRWVNSFENFLEDMGEPPPGLTIDRLDSDGDYCKENCAWRTPLQQGRNRRNVHRLTFDGHTMTLGEWAEKLGVPYRLLSVRFHRGWPLERILTPALTKWVRNSSRNCTEK